MVNIANVAKRVLDETLSGNIHQITNLNNEEILIADQVLNALDNISNSDSYEIDEEDTLELADKAGTDFISEENDEIFVSKNSNFTLDYMRKVVDFARPGIAFTTVQHTFSRMKYPMQLARFREYVKNDGNRRQKLSRLERLVFEKFRQVRDKNLPVHDADIRMWAEGQAVVENIVNFSASAHWLVNFKHRHQIWSRKVTEFVSKREVFQKEEIAEVDEEFINEVKTVLPKYRLEHIFNVDQSIFNKLHFLYFEIYIDLLPDDVYRLLPLLFSDQWKKLYHLHFKVFRRQQQIQRFSDSFKQNFTNYFNDEINRRRVKPNTMEYKTNDHEFSISF